MMHEKCLALTKQCERVKGLPEKQKGDKSYKTDSFGLGNTPEIV